MIHLNINERILAKVKNDQLLEAAIADLAAMLGHTPTTPLSTRIFCLEFGLTQEEHDKILLRLNLLSDQKNLSLAKIRTELAKVVPKTADLPDHIFNGMLSTFIKQFDISLIVSDL